MKKTSMRIRGISLCFKKGHKITFLYANFAQTPLKYHKFNLSYFTLKLVSKNQFKYSKN